MRTDYIIAGLRLSLPVELLQNAFGRSLAPFLARQGGAPDLAVETVDGDAPDLVVETADAGAPDLIVKCVDSLFAAADYRELDVFDFSELDAECRFGRDAQGYLLTMRARGDGATVRFRMAYGASVATCDCRPDHNVSFFRYGLWTVFNLAAVARKTVAIHSSAIGYAGQAVLFLGESGTGKSTHTRLWREQIAGAELLNDDSPIIRVAGPHSLPTYLPTCLPAPATVYGSPWSGKTPCYRNVANPVRAIVRLQQAPHNRIRRLRPIEAIGALLPSCPPSFAHDERLYDAVCATVSAIVAEVPVYHLECLPDAAAAELSFHTIFG